MYSLYDELISEHDETAFTIDNISRVNDAAGIGQTETVTASTPLTGVMFQVSLRELQNDVKNILDMDSKKIIIRGKVTAEFNDKVTIGTDVFKVGYNFYHIQGDYTRLFVTQVVA